MISLCSTGPNFIILAVINYSVMILHLPFSHIQDAVQSHSSCGGTFCCSSVFALFIVFKVNKD